jgi:hypothetical protein
VDLVEAVETVAAGALGSGLTPERVAARLSHPELAPAVHAPFEDQRAGDPEWKRSASGPVRFGESLPDLLLRVVDGFVHGHRGAAALRLFEASATQGFPHPAHCVG